VADAVKLPLTLNDRIQPASFSLCSTHLSIHPSHAVLSCDSSARRSFSEIHNPCYLHGRYGYSYDRFDINLQVVELRKADSATMSLKHGSEVATAEEWEEPARKRLRPNSRERDHSERGYGRRLQEPTSFNMHEVHDGQHKPDIAKDKSITIASTAKMAPQAVAPFLAKHIPAQYAPLGTAGKQQTALEKMQDPNSRYCYRHRPDMLCRRQADEPTMDKMQKVCRSPETTR